MATVCETIRDFDEILTGLDRVPSHWNRDPTGEERPPSRLPRPLPTDGSPAGNASAGTPRVFPKPPGAFFAPGDGRGSRRRAAATPGPEFDGDAPRLSTQEEWKRPERQRTTGSWPECEMAAWIRPANRSSGKSPPPPTVRRPKPKTRFAPRPLGNRPGSLEPGGPIKFPGRTRLRSRRPTRRFPSAGTGWGKRTIRSDDPPGIGLDIGCRRDGRSFRPRGFDPGRIPPNIVSRPETSGCRFHGETR